MREKKQNWTQLANAIKRARRSSSHRVNCTLRARFALDMPKVLRIEWCAHMEVFGGHEKKEKKRRKKCTHIQQQHPFHSGKTNIAPTPASIRCVSVSLCAVCVDNNWTERVHSLLQQFVKLCINVHDNAATTASATAAATTLLKFYFVVLICSVALNKSMRTAPSANSWCFTIAICAALFSVITILHLFVIHLEPTRPITCKMYNVTHGECVFECVNKFNYGSRTQISCLEPFSWQLKAKMFFRTWVLTIEWMQIRQTSEEK